MCKQSKYSEQLAVKPRREPEKRFGAAAAGRAASGYGTGLCLPAPTEKAETKKAGYRIGSSTTSTTKTRLCIDEKYKRNGVEPRASLVVILWPVLHSR